MTWLSFVTVQIQYFSCIYLHHIEVHFYFYHSTNVLSFYKCLTFVAKEIQHLYPAEQFLLAQMSSSDFFCVCFPASAVTACLHTLRGQMAGGKAFSHQSEGTTGLPHQSRERQSVFPFLVSFTLLCDGRLKGNRQLILGELAALGSSRGWRGYFFLLGSPLG